MNEALLQDARRAHQAGELERAALLYRQILAADARNFDALYLLAFVHLQRGQWEHAERLLGEALAVNPRVADAWYNRGRALLRLGRPAEALGAFETALDIHPAAPELLLHRGNALWGLNRAVEALASYDRALAIKPDFPEAWHDRGNALAALNRPDEALASYDRVLAARPGDAVTLYHRALTLFDLKRFEEASRDFEALLAAKPDFPYARGNLVHSKLSVCDWDGFETQRTEVGARLDAGQRVVTPIQNAAFSFSPGEQLHAARIWAADKYPRAPQPLWSGEIYRHDRIRIAYLSADFHSHATAALMAGVFETHDRARFQTVAVSYGPDDKSDMRARLIAAFDRFADVRERSDSEIARLLREMEIGIAVDLKGYTQDSRPDILAHRPAPVQVNYLGFPGTMGANTIDYIIADGTIIPPEHEAYTEKIARLPDTYQGNDAKRRIAERTPARTEAGLPEQGFVFCCFNNNFKILPEMFAVWMRLLGAVEASVLWLLQDNAAAARNLKREAASCGIDPDRLVFAPRADYDAHIARHRLADLFLDTLPYCAHTSASDALWAGLPIVTCRGPTFSGRVAASLLKAVGLPELITESLGAYESLALNLARNPASLAALKSKLAQNRLTHPLFDTVRFTRNLEMAYAAMWQRHASGLPPVSFAVGNAPGAAETNFQTLYDLALVHFRDGQFEDAVRYATAAIDLVPGSAEGVFLKGSALKNLKRYDAALECFERALSLRPGYVEALNNRGVIFLALERYAEALASFDTSAVDGGEAQAIVGNNRAAALLGLNRYEEALAACEASLALMPERADTLGTHGAVLVGLGRNDEALSSLAKAIALKPDYAEAFNTRANALVELGRLDEALADYDRAIALDPHSAGAVNHRGICKLLAGDMRGGWLDHESRWNARDFKSPRPAIGAPEWSGENLQGRSILVYAEQGLGDVIQFCRYLPLLAAQGAAVTFLAPAQLHRLLSSLAGPIRLVSSLEDNPQFDAQCALLSLPYRFGTDLTNIPAAVPYLSVDIERAAFWRRQIGPRGFKIGVCWQGNPSVVPARFFPLRELAALSQIGGVRLIGLQKTHGLEQLTGLGAEMNVETLGDAFDEADDAFIDTAAVMEHLDLIVSCDTSIAHLAGALARPAWVALRRVPDWRWLTDRTDSPWYPTLRLYRQPKPGDWASVFGAMTGDLRRILRSRNQ